MKKRYDEIILSGLAPEKVQFGCLALLAVVDFSMMTLFVKNTWYFTFPISNYLVVFASAFIGASLVSKLSRSAVRNFLVGGVMVAWLTFAQWIQHVRMENPDTISMWWMAYLLAFPFAAATKDQAQKGLRLIGGTAVAASLLSAVYAVLLTLGVLPGFMSKVIYFDFNGRLITQYHPVISGWVFMIGIAFSVGFFFRTKNKYIRAGLALAVVVQFSMQSLTNSRAPTMMSCAIIAGAVFFSILRGEWKRFLVGLLAAVVVVGALFTASDALYERNYRKLEQQVEQEIAQAAEAGEEADEGKELRARRGLLSDMKNLNNRTNIWINAFQALEEHPQYIVRGTAHISEALTRWNNPNTHNSWLEMLLGFGVPALLISLWFTFVAARGALLILFSSKTDLWQKVVAMLVGAMLIAGILEPFLFAAYYTNHFITVVFMMSIGYLDEWRLQLKQGN